MTGFYSRVSVLDIVSLSRQRDTAVVLPTLEYAIEYWAIVKTAFSELVGDYRLNFTKTAIVDKSAHTATRLWVPYPRNPTMPMDFPHRYKYRCDYCSPYYTRRELREIAGDL